MLTSVTHLRMGQAARLLGVSDDTVRRLAEAGELEVSRDAAGRQVVEGLSLARYLRGRAGEPESEHRSSARNRLVGLVTDVKRDDVMSQVEMQCGPFRLVSLMSTEAVDDLGIEPGVLAAAVVKATTVIVELADPDSL